jgi:hypothetical protein
MIRNKWIALALCVMPWLNPMGFVLAVMLTGLSLVSFFESPSKSVFILLTYGPVLYMYLLFVINTIKLFRRIK